MAPADLNHLCENPGIEDGTDPRVFFRQDVPSETHRSRRLCGAVHRTLALCLSSAVGNGAHDLAAESVELAASRGWLLVVLRTARRIDGADRRRLLQALDAARGTLRAEIGRAIRRQRVPDLTFLLLGPGEQR